MLTTAAGTEAPRRRGFLFVPAYRPAPEPGVGAIVDPLGEVLIKLFPDGFNPLFCAAAALPA